MNKFLFIFIPIVLTFQIKVVALTVDFSFNEVCLGDSTTFISLSFASPNDSIRYQWWDLTGDGRFNDGTGDTVTWLFPDSGYPSVGLKVLTWGGEVSALYKLVPVGEVEANFHFSDGCTGQPVPFYDNSKVFGDEAASYTWNFGDGSSSNERNPIHKFFNTGDYKVIFSIITKIGCTDSMTDTIAIGKSPALTLQFSGDTVFFAGDSVIVSTLETFDSVFWSTGQTTHSITIYSGGTFKVKGWGGGCYNEKSFTTRIKEYEKNPVITTLFTPNGDGINDFWEILNLPTVMPCEATVYNRFGEKVCSTTDYRNDWDGSFNGKILPNDTYYYFVRCYDNVLYKGTVNILK